ncbi:MarR family winged helix-turn-helix transcriptional regulator [Glycomyces buryatensis]|uniref:MarR family transcriptional regulator n=1 Tax=Glycomyces buryatensis TaxID=2570927 RepID=A0A4V6T6R8_9ACTN|nr:MarR family transcriptional regulator [Glycomyces buryatensis]THV42706.1 MarR family transcriptional regulator [Glycomyces buryatensis]
MEDNADLRFERGDQTPERFKRQFSRLVGMTAAQARKVAGDALDGVGARRYHYMVLASLAEFGPASQAALADRSGVFRSDLVAVLNELVADGYIQRGPDPADKRRNVITMTEAGERRVIELDRILDGVNEKVLAPLTKAERGELFSLLGRVNAHLAREDFAR